MLALRKKVLDPIMEATGKKITVTDLLSLAVVKTLMKHPYINASLTEDGKTIITHKLCQPLRWQLEWIMD